MQAVSTPLSPLLEPSCLSRKKQILVLYSEGGGGHKTAAEAIEHLLLSKYDVVLVNVLTEIFSAVDFFNLLSKGKFSAEDLYNSMMKKEMHSLVKLYAFLGKGYMKVQDKNLQKLFEKYLAKAPFKPDLIISVLPFFNGAMAPIALNHDIPFVLMPTDLNVSTFLIGLPHTKIRNSKRFAFAFAYDDQELKEKVLKKLTLHKEQFVITGFPVRPSCLKEYQKEEVKAFRKNFSHRPHCPIITLVLGASGGEKIVSYTQEIALLEPPEEWGLELNACVGRNGGAAKKILSNLLNQGGICTHNSENHSIVTMPSGLHVHIRGFLKNLPELMACSDLIISKTGSATVNEAIYLRKKLLLDNTPASSSRKLDWESANVPFVKRHHLGDAFNSLEELNPKILFLLKSLQTGEGKKSLNIPNFEENLSSLVEKMLQS